jgi:cbb3-type cytochrome oxidase maturation protein
MDSLLILIPIALLFTAMAVAAFFWAVNTGQYDDLDRAARDILFDDDKPAQTEEPKERTKSEAQRPE